MFLMAKKVFTIIFIVFFVPCAILALILMNLRLTLLSADFVKKGLIRADFYNQAINKVLISLVNTNNQDGSFSFGPVDKDELVVILNKALPPGNLQSQVENGLTNFGQFLAGERADLGIIFNLGEPKKTLESQLSKSLEKEWENLPTCSDSQADSEELAADCKPSDTIADVEVHNLLYDSSSGILKNVPDNLNIQNTWVKNLSVLDSAKNIYRFVDLGGKIALIVSLFLLLFIILLNLKPIFALFKTSGVALIIPSGLVMVGTVVFHIIFFAFVTANLKLGLLEELTSLSLALIKSIIGRYLLQTEIVSGVLVVIAITLLILAHHFYKKSGNRVIQAQPQVQPELRNMDSLPTRR